MATTGPSPLSPGRRGRRVAWTQHTSYAGAAGIHSEVSPAPRPLQATGRRQLHASLTHLQSLHQQEMKHLHRQRRAVQASMLAYATKMKEISSERLSVNSPTLRHHFGLTRSDKASAHRKGGGGKSSDTADKIQTSLKTGQNDLDQSPEESVDKPTKPRPRISVDSGVDVTEAWVEERAEKGPDRPSLPTKTTPSVDSPRERRRASIHTIEDPAHLHTAQHRERGDLKKLRPASFHVTGISDVCEESLEGSGKSGTIFHASGASRHRRSGAGQSPNLLLGKFRNQNDREIRELEHREFLSSLPDPSDLFPAISPFPEFNDVFKLEDKGGMRDLTAGNESHIHIPFSLPLSPSKLKKTKEHYWSLKKIQTERRHPARASKTLSKHRRYPLSSLSPRQTGLRGSKTSKTKLRLSRQTSFHQFFRYSDAVESLLRSFEDCTVDGGDQRQVRRAAELLPTLDLCDLKEERRLKEGRKPGQWTNTQDTNVDSVQTNNPGNDDTHDDTNDVTHDDTNDESREDREDDGTDIRSDYGSDDDSVESLTSSEGPNDDDSDSAGSAEQMGRGYVNSSCPRKAVHVSFLLPPQQFY